MYLSALILQTNVKTWLDACLSLKCCLYSCYSMTCYQLIPVGSPYYYDYSDKLQKHVVYQKTQNAFLNLFMVGPTSFTSLNIVANSSFIARLRLSMSPRRFLLVRKLFSVKKTDKAFRASSIS